MDLHKPKPWHGLREFLKEYLIIVTGVLTALAAEAVVERLHEARLSAEARESVRAEIDLDLASLRQYDGLRPCVDKRFSDVQGALDAADKGRAFPALNYIGRPRLPAIYHARWDAATSGGRTSLLSTDEQRDLVRVYASVGKVVERENDLAAGFGRLRSLEGVAHPSAETLALARQSLAEAREAEFFLRQGIRAVRFYADRIGLRGKTSRLDFAGDSRMDPSCVPVTTRREDVPALTGTDGAP